jgi:hypothetical protein
MPRLVWAQAQMHKALGKQREMRLDFLIEISFQPAAT